MTSDFRTSVKLWVDVIAFVSLLVICGIALRFFLSGTELDTIVARTPSWAWLLVGIWGLWSLGRFGWGLWQRRASRAS